MTPAPRPHTTRVAVSLSAGERDALRQLAVHAQEPESRTAARLIRAGLADAGAALDSAPSRRGGNAARRRAGSGPPWLPSTKCAAGIRALRDRYPHELRHLPDDVERDRLVAEQLAALSVWRDQLDAGIHADPRMELALGAELRSLSRWLEERARRRR
jgi:hypothetical protein